ncbi:MAG: F-box protein [Legionellales bacterium]
MLPEYITEHPYFHNIGEKEGLDVLSQSDINSANCLFCNGNQENEFLLLRKISHSNSFNIITDKFIYNAQKKTIKTSSRGNIFSGLQEIVSDFCYVSAHIFSVLKKPIPPPPIPKFNPIITHRMSMQEGADLLPLPDELNKTIFDMLDLPSLLSCASVSKSWHGFFNNNLEVIIQQKGKAEAAQSRLIASKNESERIQRLISRHRGGGWGGVILE